MAAKFALLTALERSLTQFREDQRRAGKDDWAEALMPLGINGLRYWLEMVSTDFIICWDAPSGMTGRTARWWDRAAIQFIDFPPY